MIFDKLSHKFILSINIQNLYQFSREKFINKHIFNTISTLHKCPSLKKYMLKKSEKIIILKM